MFDDRPQLSAWITFAGCVLVVAVLYWAQDVLVPVFLAVLLTFVLTPPVVWLQRRIGKVAAVLCVVVLVFTFLGLAGWGVVRQMSHLSTDIHTYRANIQAKLTDLRGVREGARCRSSSGRCASCRGTSGGGTQRRAPSKPLVVTTGSGTAPVAAGWMGPLVEPAGQAVFIVTLVMFMLLEREHLRDRVLESGRARPSRAHHQGARRSGPARQPATAAADDRESDLRVDRRRGAVGVRRSVSALLGRRRRRAAIHSLSRTVVGRRRSDR